jgi:hypothetical protein
MGWGYLPNLLRAGAGQSGFGNVFGMTWHENVSLRGMVSKAFGYLEPPFPPSPLYQRGYYVVVPPNLQRIASIVGVLSQALALLWCIRVLLRRTAESDAARLCWNWAFVAATMLIVAPQASHDYMVLTLGAFSFALAVCAAVSRPPWIAFAAAVLLVANIAPRALFARLVLIDWLVRTSGYVHLTRAEAYQYFGFPLLGLGFLVLALLHLREAPVSAPTADVL